MTRSSDHGLQSIVLETSVEDPDEDYGPGVRSRDCSARQNASNGGSIINAAEDLQTRSP
jgi:hypothetical protein